MKIKIDIIHFINAPPFFFFFVDAEASQLKAFQLFLLGHIFYTYIHTYICDFDEFETKDLAEGKIGDLISRLEFCSNAIIESLPNTFQSFVPVKFSTDKLLEESKGLLDV
ncbi:uncharacterized protein YJR079W [Saccharomyces cerevisiae S288C]|uniref:Uncharacterized protein YJR079W n=1 Tax=Saccharomyces cerevisiae (strain ATCC 204508 / S288c) TaxID=559292 RepID=YJ49_YEAST|nr:uncharacterized protein YJR079W [Saccharomyces cerevisiae S288C]P47126.1 RecName: Full=Uncharacterized protein YJR079W [Saccharomyces cerevisiae S288C]KAF6740681.1 uncharacterized protein GI527_G0006264 isoform 1 [Saccharomyces cerevisiae]KAG2514959.1 uncharacterized protein INSC1019_17080 [Saccharomyces cerevisiae]CAA89607.1 unnamed protein product [Saccharomyces cerevisiae]DAA08865.1 TPA: hypothetical protein YJR079W [Saccharomyces cerevisiae S288C]|eukprot:NP_012613.1 hypothetical protein YJR079W [Saccharomyces cerevisiae S288C]